MPEVLGDAVHYFDPQDIENIAQVTAEVAQNYYLKQTLRSAGFKQVKKYSFDLMAKQTLDVYQKVLEGK